MTSYIDIISNKNIKTILFPFTNQIYKIPYYEKDGIFLFKCIEIGKLFNIASINKYVYRNIEKTEIIKIYNQ